MIWAFLVVFIPVSCAAGGAFLLLFDQSMSTMLLDRISVSPGRCSCFVNSCSSLFLESVLPGPVTFRTAAKFVVRSWVCTDVFRFGAALLVSLFFAVFFVLRLTPIAIFFGASHLRCFFFFFRFIGVFCFSFFRVHYLCCVVRGT